MLVLAALGRAAAVWVARTGEYKGNPLSRRIGRSLVALTLPTLYPEPTEP